MCRRRLQEEQVAPDQLLAGLHQLVKAVDALHQLLPQASLQRATRAAEQLAKRAMDAEVTALEQRLTSQVGALLGFEADAAAADAMHEQLRLAGSEITAHVRDALSATAPLIVLCELLGLRADGMAKHLVTRLTAPSARSRRPRSRRRPSRAACWCARACAFTWCPRASSRSPRCSSPSSRPTASAAPPSASTRRR